MFHACRRGPASIAKFLAHRPSLNVLRVSATRPSTLFISQATANIFPEARLIHISSKLSDASQPVLSRDRVEETQQQDAEPITRFAQLKELDMVHSNILHALTGDMKFDKMTDVQSLTINKGLQGNDIIAQARTGTGKTVGFLLPTLANILQKHPELAERKKYFRARPSDTMAIIISPTRELAEQISVECERMVKHTNLRVQLAVGGTHKGAALQKIRREGCHILVATPGRLNDLLSDEYSGVQAPDLKTLVLDEADRLLDQGFSTEIESIIRLLPDRAVVDRQTMMFSATIPREVMHLVRSTLKPNFEFVQTVSEDEVPTHDKIPQKFVRVPGLENYMPTLLELCKREKDAFEKAKAEGTEARPFKAIVYFSSTANVELGARIFENLRESSGIFGKHPLFPTEILEMHAGLVQNKRTRISERFRRADSAVLFSTDVTARGMDFPNVTHVIQIGLPPNRDQYVHRIGRTGRAGKEGEGFLFMQEEDTHEARKLLRGLPLEEDRSLTTAQVDMTRDAQLPASTASILSQIGNAVKMVDRRTKERAYLAALGQAGGRGKYQIAGLNQWTRFGWGWEKPPAVNASLAQRLGISRAPGINIMERGQRESFDNDDGLNGPAKDRSDYVGGRSAGGFGGGFGGFEGRKRDFNRRDNEGFSNDRREFGRDRNGFGGRRGGFGQSDGQRDRW